jgi:hypothetical protein
MEDEKPTLPESLINEPVSREYKPGPRPNRRAEEDAPSRDYLRLMETLGPRERESLIAYSKRMAAVREGRKVWIETWKRLEGDHEACAKALGIPRNNVAHELRMVGLSKEILDQMLCENSWEEL